MDVGPSCLVGREGVFELSKGKRTRGRFGKTGAYVVNANGKGGARLPMRATKAKTRFLGAGPRKRASATNTGGSSEEQGWGTKKSHLPVESDSEKFHEREGRT